VSVLRGDLLAGCEVAVAGDRAIAPALEDLGARLRDVADSPLQALVFDARPAFAAGGLSAALDECWTAVSAVAPALIERPGPGKLVFVAPAVGMHAAAARAGLENLARTLSIEWARFGITTCAIWPGPDTRSEDLDELTAFLLSPAGEYFSGCRVELR
jgi:NAD(P)-dependent dehydrogenase (short-subunit alcohol dehydrogenase family)